MGYLTTRSFLFLGKTVILYVIIVLLYNYFFQFNKYYTVLSYCL